MEWIFGPKRLTPEKMDAEIQRNLEEPFVKFMLQKLEAAGCKVEKSFINHKECEKEVLGGFMVPDGVVLCRDTITPSQIPNTLTHELIHAYDHCRGKGFSLTNCEHHACTEIRAANLSRDCYFNEELKRGNIGWGSLIGQGNRCVRRRAEMSVSLNPYCAHCAKEVVDKVFDQCIKDTEPFDRVP